MLSVRKKSKLPRESPIVTPTPSAGRIKSLDVVRGFAVLGILIVNAAYFAAPWQTSQNPALAPLAVDDRTLWSWFVMHTFFEYKCITLFSLLFGASIVMVGGETGDRIRGAVLRRRLFWLFIFGLIHGALIWSGDILLTYALTGFIIAPLRSMRPRDLMQVGILLLSLSLLLHALSGAMFESVDARTLAEMETRNWAPPAAEVDRMIDAYRSGLNGAMRENVSAWFEYIVNGLPFIALRTAGVMLIGMALFKIGFLSGDASLSAYILVLAAGAIALGLIGWQAWLNYEAHFAFVHMQARGMFANAALSIFASLGYASVFVLLVKGGVRLAPLAAVGRMAFTNYITQSLIMTTIFWGGRGFGLFGQLDRPALWAVVAAIWALQLIWSPVWLSRFELGPFEWVWRRLSLGSPVAFARAQARNSREESP